MPVRASDPAARALSTPDLGDESEFSSGAAGCARKVAIAPAAGARAAAPDPVSPDPPVAAAPACADSASSLLGRDELAAGAAPGVLEAAPGAGVPAEAAASACGSGVALLVARLTETLRVEPGRPAA